MDGKRAYRKKANSAAEVAAGIRRAARHGDLLPGEHVRQAEWAQRIGVSGGPTREALKMLVSEGILSYEAHHGYFVTRIGPGELTQIYRLRQALEELLLRSIRWPTPDELDGLRRRMSRTVELAGGPDVRAAVESAREVLFTLFELSAPDPDPPGAGAPRGHVQRRLSSPSGPEHRPARHPVRRRLTAAGSSGNMLRIKYR